MSVFNTYVPGGMMFHTLALLKMSLIGVAALAVVGGVESVIPANWSIYVNIFLLGWGGHGACCAYVGGMTKPHADSSDGYRHWYKTCHLFLKISGAWKLDKLEETK